MKEHIVVIEDNPDILEVVEHLLNEEGYQVTTMSALHDIDALLALNADLYILDEQLPYINGHIICIILKSKPQTRNKPVLLISALEEVNQFATLCEADGYLKKPFLNIAELTTLVKNLLRSSQLSM
ncbi:response regulator transcription factor [Mucilaginibacter myungsuensis]|uniref:Response regulator transcription factor n=2 Tax=Mucilaginibacter myungsuensis TaxID=649104 RepID=A0A929PY44_9SPHI|nr:response regulator [Mucilaginibacter myungsuensis]MBE9663846.1 response regulator transcription factor [Mucilaginibacter myungsuensis]